ncbi:hypothetical protein ACE6H2_025757 [Prunus campanulata]
MARKEFANLEYRKSHIDIVSVLKCFDKGENAFTISKRLLEDQILKVVNLHGSVEESDFVRLEPNKETRPKMPIKVNQSLEIKTNSGGKTVEPHKTSVNEFDHSKMFQLLPTQMMDCNQESSPKTPTKGNQTMEMGISSVQTVAVRRLRVGKCLSLHDADILKKYLDDALWHGIHSTVYRKDALDLLHEEYISIQAMESYLEILNGDQMNLPRGHLKSCFMPTFGWVKAVYLQDLLKKMRYNDLVFFPIIHVKQEHFTFFDCGVAVMYIMKTLSEGKALDPVFLPGAMKNMRAHVLGRFINDDECSWDAYKIN